MEKFKKTYIHVTKGMVEIKLLEMMKGQSRELREWFWKEQLNRYADHIKVAESSKPRVDIRLLIFDELDLERCLALRQVSSEWYITFNSCEGVMKSQMLKRNPWVRPGDPDLQSWADCVLVFGSRLKSGKWKTLESVEDMERQEIPASLNVVVGLELKEHARFPESLAGLFDKTYVQLKAEKGVEYRLNPWTLSSRRGYIEPTTVREDVLGTVINYEGIDITLDPSIRASDVKKVRVLRPGNWPVRLGIYTIQVTLDSGNVVLFPRDNPHYKYAMTLDDDSLNDEIGDVFVQHVKERDGKFVYYFVDVETKQRVRISEATTANPEASFNGLKWWAFQGNLTPTFVDLQTPGVIYCNPD
ncbi:hypothetical protein CJU89_1182 [Yarrowia sp. B02]|nr:hypothetical protein CJU89_1182 [Yarrowia sp. B02]